MGINAAGEIIFVAHVAGSRSYDGNMHQRLPEWGVPVFESLPLRLEEAMHRPPTPSTV